MKTTHRRFLSNFYDSVSQRSYPAFCESFPEAKNMYIGRLRFDALLSETLVLTDAQVFDGQFFQDAGPRTLALALARNSEDPMPIQIMSRAQKLDDALLLFFKRLGAERLRGLALSLLNDDDTRSEVKNKLADMDAESVRSWRDIPRILREIGVTDAETQRIESGWAHWIEAQKNGQVTVVQWQGDFELDRALSSRDTLVANQLETPEARELIAEIYNYRADRNTVDRKLAECKAVWDGPRLLARYKNYGILVQ